MTTADDRPAVVLRELLMAFGRCDLDAMKTRWTDHTSGRLHPLSTTLRDGDEVVQFFETAFSMLGELELEIQDVHESGDTAIARWRLQASFIGEEIAGFRPTGQRIDVHGVDVQRIIDGVVDHAEVYFDGLTVARQLGFAPDAGSTIEHAVRGVVNARSAVDRIGRRLLGGAGSEPDDE